MGELQLGMVSNITGIYILGFLGWYSLRTYSVRSRKYRYLYFLLAASLLELITHLTTIVLETNNFFYNRTIGVVMYSLVITVNNIYILGWVMYLIDRLGKDSVDKSVNRRRRIIMATPIIILMILSIINIFVPVYFSYQLFDYQRKIWFYLTMLVPGCYMLYGIILFLRTTKKKKLYQEFPFVAFIFPVAVAHLLEIIFEDLCVIPLANTLALNNLMLLNAKQNASIDPMSGVYTKSELYRYFDDDKTQSAFSENMRGIMIRLEYLQSIIQKYGHKTGDLAISDMGYLIRKNTSGGLVTFHYADNLFIVLFENMQEDDVRSFISNLKAELMQFNKKTATLYELHFSYGIASFEENDSIERFIDRMENSMLQNRKGKLSVNCD